MALQIVNITNAARQQYNLVGDNNVVVQLTLIFLPTQNGWAFNISYNDFTYNGGLLTVSPNFLRNYRNIIPFGIMCTSVDGYEPQFINDFIDGRINLYLLNAAEVIETEAEFFQ